MQRQTAHVGLLLMALQGQSCAAGPATAAVAKPEQQKVFCRKCGNALSLRIPPGEHVWRNVCPACGFIDYINPKMVTPASRSLSFGNAQEQ